MVFLGSFTLVWSTVKVLKRDSVEELKEEKRKRKEKKEKKKNFGPHLHPRRGVIPN